MASRLTLVAHAPTAATRRAAFPADEDITDDAIEPSPLRAALVLTGSELRCRRTVAALGWTATVAPEFTDLDAGRWRARTIDELAGTEPDALAAWLTDPSARPHGGESLADLVTRVGVALDARDWPDGRSVVVTSPPVVRAALVHLLRAPLPLIFGFDVAPLSATTLSGHRGRWVLRSMQPVHAWRRPFG